MATNDDDFQQAAERRYADIVATGNTIPWEEMRGYLENRVAELRKAVAEARDSVDDGVRAVAEALAVDELGIDDPDALADVLLLEDGGKRLARIRTMVRELAGGDADEMRRWMRTENAGAGGVPAEQVRTEQGMRAVERHLLSTHRIS